MLQFLHQFMSPTGAEGHALDSPVSNASKASSGRALWLVLALVALNVAVYAPVARYGFVTFDDPQYVTANPEVSGGVTWQGVGWAFTTGYFSNWHPLTWLSHMLDVQMYGTYAGGHHITNVLLHIANTLLLFGLLRRMTGGLGRSAVVAGLFAVHPLHVESVVWVSERKDVLSTLFGFLALWGYVSYVRRPRLGRYLVVLVFFGLGLMAKPMLVTLPFVLLLLDVWPLGRITLPADSSGGLGWQALRDQKPVAARLLWEKLPFIALAAASSIVTFVVQQRGGSVGGFEALPLDFRVANALTAYVAYLAKMLWPAGLSVIYPYPDTLPGWWVFGSLFVLIGVSAAVMRRSPRNRYLAVGWLWYLGTLAPVIGLVQVGQQAMADRYTYIPLIGVFLMIAWGIPDLLAGWPYQRIVLGTGAVCAITVCAVIARGEVRHWENSRTLFAHALEVTAENHLAHNGLGYALATQGRFEEAAVQYAEAIRINPYYAEAHYNLGVALASQGKMNEAMARYAEALRINPDFADAHSNLGVALARQGRLVEATVHYREALRINPSLPEAHVNLGNVLVREGNLGEAITHYREAIRLRPGYPEAHNNLAVALSSQGHVEEAIREYAEVLRMMPGQASVHYRLAVLLGRTGNTAEAIRNLETALHLNPALQEARRALDELTGRGAQFETEAPRQ